VLIFAIPALAGALVFIVPQYLRSRSLAFLLDKRVFLTGFLYFAEQFSIIASTIKNGPVLTALFVLFGDAILSPLLSILFRVNSVYLRYFIFVSSLIITIPSSALLILYGNTLKSPDILGLVFLIAVMVLVPVAFIIMNMVINEKGASYTLSGTFFWPGVVTLTIGLAGFFPSASVMNDPIGFGALMFTGITSMGFAYFLFFESSKRTGFAIASVLQALIPVFTLVTIHFTENAPITDYLMIFLALACFGASLSAYSVKEGPGSMARTA
jgi:drug/metabolite transporter (DMT)-like permease